MLRSLLSFILLAKVKIASSLFYRVDIRWIEVPPEDPWGSIRLVAFLNHTSLYEPLFAGGVPFKFFWRLATRGVIPVATKTLRRPLVGKFFSLVARHIVSITREPDHTWAAVLSKIEPDSLVLIAPEGRMKRADGLDKNGNPMSVRGGISDVIRAVPEGKFLLAYSCGLHHVQAPGQHIPKFFRRIHMNLELVELAEYRERLEARAAAEQRRFKNLVKEDLDRRRDTYCKLDIAPRSHRVS